MARIIHFETSGPNCSVAIGIDGVLISFVQDEASHGHAKNITLIMDNALEKAGYTLSQIDAVAVSSGPGSYTGLRVGSSAAKGICFARDIPLIAISTLEALADAAYVQSGDQEALFIPMIDARRMEVYTAAYNSALETILRPQAKIVDDSGYDDLVTDWHKSVIYCGSGLKKCMHLLSSSNAKFYPEMNPSAEYLIRLAFEKYREEKFEEVAYFKPFYLKPPNITIPKPML